jgi:hypothetical protein
MRRLFLQTLLRLRRLRLGVRWLRWYLLDMDANLGVGLHLLGRVHAFGTDISFG